MAEIRRGSWEEASDTALALAVERRDEDALTEAYRRHSAPVLSLARRVLRERTLAEEVAQEVFVRLWQAPERFDPERGTLRSYLLAQAHHRAVDLLRSERSRKRREEREATVRPVAASQLEDEVWELSVSEKVKGALAALSDDERRAIELAYFRGHTYREVALVLEEPEGTIKSRIRTGLRRMREPLAETGVMAA